MMAVKGGRGKAKTEISLRILNSLSITFNLFIKNILFFSSSSPPFILGSLRSAASPSPYYRSIRTNLLGISDTRLTGVRDASSASLRRIRHKFSLPLSQSHYFFIQALTDTLPLLFYQRYLAAFLRNSTSQTQGIFSTKTLVRKTLRADRWLTKTNCL